MVDEPHDVDPETMNRLELIEEVHRLRKQIADDKDYYRKCRDLMAEKLHAYNDKFNLQEEVIHDLEKEIKSKINPKESGEEEKPKEIAKVPQFARETPTKLTKFNRKMLI